MLTIFISRFIASTTAGAVLRFFLNTLTLLLAVCGPVSVVVFFILIKFDLFQSLFQLDGEFWFGVEVGVYIIFPLLLLTIFGTVNCCKVSMSSRMVPTHQVQAIKINIGLTVTTNFTLFLFLVQVREKLISLEVLYSNFCSGMFESLAATVERQGGR